jgi:3-deoxy-manno-octulosonate cytidylyltransferase (CMP-KDO synthetase)
MQILGVIPARYGSTRFEGKPLADINGHTMIEWVYKRSLNSGYNKIVVATDDKRIYNIVKEFGGEVIMTQNHETGTDRIAEVVQKMKEYDVIVNIQGDEPLVEGEILKSLVKPFEEDKSVVMVTMKHKIESKEDIENPNVVKVITDKNEFAVYFSRSPIPYSRNKEGIEYYRHIGLYAYSREFLLQYAKMKQTMLEKAESLEQLRVLENGYKIKVIETETVVKGVDTIEDLQEVNRFIIENKIQI